MSYPYNKELKENSQALRKKMTPEEKHLWYDFLRYLPYSVKRQKVVGNYILDFYVPEKKLAIELDGKQHQIRERFDYDQARDEYLKAQGIQVRRYTNGDIRDRFEIVKEELLRILELKVEDLKDRG